MPTTKKWYQSKTIILAIIQGLVGVIIAFSSQYPSIGELLVLKSFLEFALRIITDTPISFN